MIIAEIGSYKFKLEGLKEAETLLAIFEKSEPVEYDYDISAIKEATHAPTVSVEIRRDPKVLTAEEAAAQKTKLGV